MDRAIALGASVTVRNRTRRHAARFAAAGARVVDLADLPASLGTCDVAILATTTPQPLVDARLLRTARPAGSAQLTLADLSLPRNVDPDVRTLPSVRLIDLADLRDDATAGSGHPASDVASNPASDLASDVAITEEIIDGEVRRYLRWLAGQSVAASLRRIHRDAEHIAREELAHATGGLPSDVHEALKRALLRTVHRLAYGRTRHLRGTPTS